MIFFPHTLPSFDHARMHSFGVYELYVCVCEYIRTMVHMS